MAVKKELGLKNGFTLFRCMCIEEAIQKHEKLTIMVGEGGVVGGIA